MDCPSCHAATRVLETRREDRGAAVKRRRECSSCGSRFTTFERRERPPLFVLKRGGRRERFDAEKLRDGMLRATYTRPVTAEQIDSIAEDIEAEAEAAGGELEASRIGEMCLAGLGEVDRVSYLQFAAVYRQLADVEDVQAELRRLGASTPFERPSNGGRTGAAAAPIPSDDDASIASPPERGQRAGNSRKDLARREHGAHRQRR